MKRTAYVLLASVLFFGSASLAFADISHAPNAPTDPQAQFGFYCNPYSSSFASGGYYISTGGTCTYLLPQQETSATNIFLAVYKGTPGNATPANFNFGANQPASILQTSPDDWVSQGSQGDDFFAVAGGWDTLSNLGAEDNALRTGGTPPLPYDILQWKWGNPLALPITIAVPQSNTTYFSTDSIIPQATIANLASYTSVVYLFNGTPVNPTQPLPFATLLSGTSTLVIAATDSLGNTTFATSTFLVVNPTPPAITITSPLNGHSYLQNDVASINATITDPSGIATTTYKLNGTPVDPTQMLPFMSQPLGTETLVVSATNTFGITGYATSTFTLLPPDLTAPTITISSPTAGATYTDAANVFLTANITDASPIAATSYTFNGATIDPTLPLPLLGAPLGPASVSVAATDAYGNAASSTVSFVIKSSDVTPPTITITNPLAGHTYLSTANVLAAATITDASGVTTSSYTLDGIPVNPAQPLPLNLAGTGPATLVVSATDNFGNTGSSSVSFIVSAPPPPDTQAPVIVITSPLAGHRYTRRDTVFLTATITDASPIANARYYLNGQLIDKSKALALKTAPLGNNTVSVIATDSFGNKGTASLTFRIVPGDDSCIADITEGFDHKWISDKKTFAKLFDDCARIHDREGDRDNYDNDDRNHHKDSHLDDRYVKAQKDVDDAFDDIDRNIHN